ncbi:hypothetical protein ACFO3O_02385 [Dokdonia ponticola]|uniref:Uncharacterized protein n=1 Tax=Dokdonia ponticola TaxID=2041041 RepID=A0ABV9HTW7_9FLAO
MADFNIINITGNAITVNFGGQQVHVAGNHTAPEPVYQISNGQGVVITFSDGTPNQTVYAPTQAEGGNGPFILSLQPNQAGGTPLIRFQ